MANRGLSQHPADQLVRELIDTQRPATVDEVDRIIERMADVPFGAGIIAVPQRLRRFAFGGRPLRERADALLVHYVEHVASDRQWTTATTPRQYLEHLRRAGRW